MPPHHALKVACRPKSIAPLAASLALVALGQSSLALAAPACVTKAGSATGITRGFAEYEAFLIIRQVTGNWPIEQDRFSKPVYKCAQDGVLWTCRATAKVCKS
ncbi:hypothetical protein [Hyphomicrobium sp. LHD-15]|uniref:hypothetical protein n=1 Tax=Hyphomicrobium sp. LHD-15 TaxID=3072142 RepID=UPI00280CADBF|nr:hypothetical protein [Hyphomicrobium sp. LHD-15]MDQ8700571.1 hypothetical protein [Hyphomicrobium sp. LHD-15]